MTPEQFSQVIVAVCWLVFAMAVGGAFVGSFCGDFFWLVRGWFRRRRRLARMQRRAQVRA